ncbi:unnamed protein product [Clonostachys rosea]|uniref:Uncharacterized protein n=1 Tax=Bionectria ochroleuca TaxID=29856 RepID=A0ABY6ULT0_BIOOC|nr:unnamed protein product [Clonostachys rosea]
MPASTKESRRVMGSPHGRLSLDKSIDLKGDQEKVECAELENGAPERDAWLDRFELLRDKTPEELKAIDKKLLQKLDWKFLPFVSFMLIMKNAY